MQVPRIDVLNNYLIELKKHLKNIEDILKQRNSISLLVVLYVKIEKLQSRLQILSTKEILLIKQIVQEIKNILSHIQALICYLQFMRGTSSSEGGFNLASLTNLSNSILVECGFSKKPYSFEKVALENMEKVDSSNGFKSKQPEQEFEEHLQLYNEQARLNALPTVIATSKKIKLARQFDCFLEAVWRYALSKNKASKSVFISHAWPIYYPEKVSDTKIIMPITVELVRHLIKAGITVHMDYYHSGVGNVLVDFMSLVGEVDHVVVFNSQTWAYKMSLKISGILNESKNIIDSLKSLEANAQEKFLIIMSLTDKNYCQDYFGKILNEKKFHTISILGNGYLKSLKHLLKRLYEFDNDFDFEWNELLNKYKISQDWWGIQSYDSCYIDQQKRLDNLKNTLSDKASKYTIIKGETGVGKTQLALHYIYQYGYYYSAVYWFKADSVEQFKKLYDEFAQAKNVKDNVINWLAEKPKCLLIYDIKNVNNLQDFLPDTKGGTTKIIIIADINISNSNCNTIQLKGFDEAEAKEYLQIKLGNPRFDKEPKAVEELLKLLKNKGVILPKKLMYACGSIIRTYYANPIQTFIKNYPVDLNISEPYGLPLLGNHNIHLESTVDLTNEISIETDSVKLSDEKYKVCYECLISCIQQVRQACNDMAINEFNMLFKKLLSLNVKLILKSKDEEKLKVLLTHFESIINTNSSIKDLLSRDFFLSNQVGKTINDVKIFIPHDKKKKSFEYAFEAVINCEIENDDKLEKKLAKEQIDFDGKRLRKQYLESLWSYALKKSKPTKKVYIIFEHPAQDKEDQKWTVGFVERLVSHLLEAGIQVYGREWGTKGQLVKLFDQIDHILIVSSEALKRESNEDIQYILKRIKEEQKEKFYLPILLNKRNYCPMNGVVAHDFCNSDYYLDKLDAFIGGLYGFDHNSFTAYCKSQRIKYKIAENNIHTYGSMPFKEEELDEIVVRTELLKELNDKIKNSKSSKDFAAAFCLLAKGMGGMGKSTLLAYYVYTKHHHYTEVLWFDARSSEQLLSHYLSFAKQRGLVKENEDINSTALVVRVKEHILHQNILLIYDDAANEQNEGVGKLIITAQSLTVILTSRAEEWKDTRDISINVNVYSEEEAIDYVAKNLGSAFVKQNITHVKEFIGKLGHMPLALKYACAYIAMNVKYINVDITYDNDIHIELNDNTNEALINLMKKYIKDFNKIRNKQETNEATETIKNINAVLEITFKKMTEESIALLKACAFVYKNNIPYQYIEKSIGADYGEAMRVAAEYSMIKVDPATLAISVHELLQEVIRCLHLEQQDETLNKSSKVLSGIYPYGITNVEANKLKKILHSHLNFILKYINANERRSVESKINILKCLGDANDYFANPQQALINFNELIEIIKVREGENNILFVTVLQRLARIHHALGDYKKQLYLLEKRLNIISTGPENLKTPALFADTYEALGTAYGGLKQYEKTEENFLKALSYYEKRFLAVKNKPPEEQPLIIKNLKNAQSRLLMNIGNLQFELGKIEGAIEHLNKAYQIKHEIKDLDHYTYTRILENLAMVYSESSKFKNYSLSETYLKEALKIKREFYEYDNTEIAFTYKLFGELFEKQKRYKEAIKQFEEALRIKNESKETCNELLNIENKLKEVRSALTKETNNKNNFFPSETTTTTISKVVDEVDQSSKKADQATINFTSAQNYFES